MRVSIERGYHAALQQLMAQLQTDDPKLAVHHVIGCFFAAASCPAYTSAQPAPAPAELGPVEDEFADVIEY